VVSVARKLRTIEERRQDQNCFGEEITGTKFTIPKSVLGSSPGEDVFCALETNANDNNIDKTEIIFFGEEFSLTM
jgi:hypothetical protein